MQGLYGTNVNAQLAAMKQSSQDLQDLQAAQSQAPSWLQGLSNVTTGLSDIGSLAKSVKGLMPGGSTWSSSS